MYKKKYLRILKLFIFCFVFCLTFRASGEEALEPVDHTPEGILQTPAAFWRREAFEIYRWNKLKNVIIFDTLDYNIQSLFFKKLAFFAEKAGYAGKIHSLDVLEEIHGYRAHNYSALNLARFFNMASLSSLTDEEQILLKIVLHNEILMKLNGRYHPREGGILSICREGNDVLRRYLLIHELYHGIYYEIPEFEEGLIRIWNGLSDMEKEFWLLYLSSRQYDVQNSELVVNEFQSYLLQQRQENLQGIFWASVRSSVLAEFPGRIAFIDRFSRECADCLRREAEEAAMLLLELGGVYGFDYYSYLDFLKDF